MEFEEKIIIKARVTFKSKYLIFVGIVLLLSVRIENK
jgi:hypothetical protein